jgi:hypothetical protein
MPGSKRGGREAARRGCSGSATAREEQEPVSSMAPTFAPRRTGGDAARRVLG